MEYPKILYKDGTCTDAQANDVDGEGIPKNARVAKDAEEEAAHRVDGFLSIGDTAEASGPTEFETLKAEAERREIKVNGSWGVKKLREVLAAAPEA